MHFSHYRRVVGHQNLTTAQKENDYPEIHGNQIGF